MKVNVLHLLPSLDAGGVEKNFVIMGPHWDKYKYNISVGIINNCQNYYRNEIKECGILCYELGSKRRGKFEFKVIINLIRLIIKKNIKILHCHNISTQLYAQIAAIFKPKLVIVRHQHEKPTKEQCFVYKNLKFLFFFIKEVDIHLAVSKYIKLEIIKKQKLPPEKIIVVYNGIENRVRNDSKDIIINSIFTLGRLVKDKGLDTLIDSIEIVKNKVNDIEVYMIGDGVERMVLEEMVKRKGLQRNIHFLGYCKMPEKFYQHYNIYIHPSLHEGFGLAIIEVMSKGKPVIASKTGGIPEIIENNKNGILVRVGDTSELAEAILKLISNKKLSDKLSAEGIERAKYFNIKKTVRKIENIYKYNLKKIS